jgi:RNA-binding protein 26
LKDHFAAFGELSSVVLEDTEAHNHDTTLPSLSCSACVTYTTRQSAEKAFITGKSCKGHMLRFMWLTASPGSNNQSRFQKPSSLVGAAESPSPVAKISRIVTSGTSVIPHSESIPTAESSERFPVEISKVSSSSVECPPENDSTRNPLLTDPYVPQ